MRRRSFGTAFLLLLCVLYAAGTAPSAHTAVKEPDPRCVVLALWDSREEGGEVRFSRIHQLAEMPLNHLGLIIRYHDVNDPLPPLGELTDVRGVLTWFTSKFHVDREGFLDWTERVVDTGRRFAIINYIGFEQDLAGQSVRLDRLNRFVSKIGFRLEPEWAELTYRWEVGYLDPTMVGFEYPVPKVLPAFQQAVASAPGARSHLTLRQRDEPTTESHVVITTPRGGYIAVGYSSFFDPETYRRRWIVDPFCFFREAFGTDGLPKPDVTTVSGRRIYFSHIDSDGWRNVTTVGSYRDLGRPVLSAEVALKELL